MTRRAPTEALVVAAISICPRTAGTIADATGVGLSYVNLVLRRLAARGLAEVAGRGVRVGIERGRYPLLWRLV